MSKGASSIVTAVLVVGVTLTAVGVVLDVSGPAIDNARDSSAIRQSVSFLNFVDENIREVASEGQGSTRTMSVSFDRGEFDVDAEDDSFTYSLDTGSDIISPQAQQQQGAVTLSSNANVEVSETTKNGETCFMMKNDKVQACIKKVGSEDSPTSINTSELLTYYEIEGRGETPMDFEVELNNAKNSSWGEGYTYAEQLGDHQPHGDVYAVVDAENGLEYRVLFQLYSGADFLSIRVLRQQ
ncbi:MAG: hypothetical protein ABEJ36_04800 [Candidatus Nanosalina sp.]